MNTIQKKEKLKQLIGRREEISIQISDALSNKQPTASLINSKRIIDRKITNLEESLQGRNDGGKIKGHTRIQKNSTPINKTARIVAGKKK